MFAVISDIHSNLEALSAVLADVERRGIKTIYCLGDVIGYGPNPRECLDLIIGKTKWCVLGNHDCAVFYEPTNFNYGAEQASFWTRFSLEAEPNTSSRNSHASPRKPVNEYIFPDDVYTNPLKVRLLFERVKHICFVGHTHLPGVFLDEPDFYAPDELNNVYPITNKEKAIVNIGSVGQPRDRDNRPSYVYADGNEVHFVRLEYDVETTAKKIEAIEELDNFQAERLREGR
ncbi:MAG: metallophosphoesterase family protein [Planctomycetota bacterium]|jgi:predicted phosphodiesterase